MRNTAKNMFDDRMGTKFSDNAKDIGVCIHCQTTTSNYENCALKSCNELVLICVGCKSDNQKLYHTEECAFKSSVTFADASPQ